MEVMFIQAHFEDTLCVVGQAAIAQDDSIHRLYGRMIVVLELEKTTYQILRLEINSICQLTSRFVEDILLGYSLMTQLDEIERIVKSRYLGNSPAVIVVALRDARNRLLGQKKN